MKKSVLSVLLAASSCFAGELTVKVTADKSNAIYKSGETAVITAAALEDGKPVSGRTVLYDFIADGNVRKKGKFVSSAEKPFVLKHKFTYPSALRAEFTILDAKGNRIPLKKGYDQVRHAGGRIGAVADPEKILPAAKTPADFDAFWNSQLKRLAAVPMKVLEKKSPAGLSASISKKHNTWDIKISSVDNVPVSGIITIPKNAKAKSMPAILLVQGAGVGSAMAYRCASWSDQEAICMEINAHGVPNGMPAKYYNDIRKGRLKNYYSKVYPNREQHIFVNMALRVIRALEYLRTLPEWNGKDLIIRGASQGGWQAIVGAGLDKKVTLCLAGVPGFGDFDGEFSPAKRMPRMHFGGAIRQQSKKGKAHVQKLLKEQSYFDPVNFAPKVTCPVYLSVGFVDLSCPATSVYAIYNSFPAKTFKKIDAYAGGVHATSPAKSGDAALKKLLKEAKK